MTQLQELEQKIIKYVPEITEIPKVVASEIGGAM